MNKFLLFVVAIMLFLSAFLIPSVALCKVYEVELNWSHSGKGMDQFVFVHAITDAGPWEGPVRNHYPVSISGLTSNIVDGKNHWTTIVTIDVKDDNQPVWWICYARNANGAVSAISQPVMSKFVLTLPDSLRKAGDFFNRKLVVTFI